MKISSIAVLLTCHNRKDKTITCLDSLFKSKQLCSNDIEMDVYLTDDGSEDGTGYAVRTSFPDVIILQGDGNLFWAGGMRNSWKEAMKRKKYDGYLLLNDDSILLDSCLDELIKTHNYSIRRHGIGGIYVGSLRDKTTLEHTYGGRIIINKWLYSCKDVIPNGTISNCQMGNANIMFVAGNVVESIGIFCGKYIHAQADFDYTLRALEKKIPIFVCAEYCGFCQRDLIVTNFKNLKLKERIKYLKSPKGFELSGYMYFMKRFFPLRAPFVFCSLWLRTLSPTYSEILDLTFDREPAVKI